MQKNLIWIHVNYIGNNAYHIIGVRWSLKILVTTGGFIYMLTKATFSRAYVNIAFKRTVSSSFDFVAFVF